MPPELEQEILQSEFAGMYVLGKSLQLFARLKPQERKVALSRLQVLLNVYATGT